MKIFALMLGACAITAGCSVFTRPQEKPVIEDSIRGGLFSEAKVGVLSLTPERRIVLHSFESNRFCAENPTDVGIDMASITRAAAAIKSSDTKSAGIEAAVAAASTNQVLNRRTAGMQLFMAASFSLCQMYLNKMASEPDYMSQQMRVFERAADLIEAEMKQPIQVVQQPDKLPNLISGLKDLSSALDGVKLNIDTASAKPASAASSPSTPTNPKN